MKPPLKTELKKNKSTFKRTQKIETKKNKTNERIEQKRDESKAGSTF